MINRCKTCEGAANLKKAWKDLLKTQAHVAGTPESRELCETFVKLRRDLENLDAHQEQLAVQGGGRRGRQICRLEGRVDGACGRERRR